MTTPTIEERLRALAEKATLGPWYMDMRPVKLADADFSVVTSAGGSVVLVADRVLSDADAALIAALDPDTVRLLADVVEAARAVSRAIAESEWPVIAGRMPLVVALAALDHHTAPEGGR